MALTPEDVVNKRFQPTKFREGYDQDEVDDFLDEVVVELRRLTQENDELRQRLARHESGASDGGTSIRPATAGDSAPGTAAAAAPTTGDAGTDTTASPAVSSTPSSSDATDTTPSGTDAAGTTTSGTDAAGTTTSGADAAGTSADAVRGGSDTTSADTTGVDATGTDATDTPTTGTPAPGVDAAADTAVPATSAAPVTASAGTTSAGTTPTADNAAGLLAMAQRIHDEYVNSGIEQRDSIIAEAQTKAETMVSDAEAHRTKTLTDLEHQKSDLERQVEQLRGFERDYRSRLKEYIEGQLHDLQSTGSVEHRSDNV
ncbi:DivIVA domain-containing protein [Tersicoccus sp. Bi-70]|uniref:DivIVA domain-containing protein n=1 Tax=Tersicoccus sp. Bi-70 TaxID=1897634 RepID=UPI0009766974|nr:DivIVA domain-containing protein [Tersicoccus sp. Bi-70]OMH33198.1 hypothetical protein BGP79_06660 [Tersicoccus sp. Bi-70]